MSKCLKNDSKIQMRFNIKRHRQKLLQYLENTNDTVLKPKIKLISNDIEKSNLNHNDKRITRSSSTVKQLQPNVKVKIKEEPLSNFELKLEPLLNIEIKNPEPSPDIVKKLKEQLIKEELYYSSSSDEIGDNISMKICEERRKRNANERKLQNRIAKRFRTLRKRCCCLNTNSRGEPSKFSILLAAKKECDLLTYYNKKILEEKTYWLKANEILKNRINELKKDGNIAHRPMIPVLEKCQPK